MSPLRAELQRYLEFRRLRGFKLKGEALYLIHFLSFLDGQGSEIVTIASCTAWNNARPGSHATKAKRVIAVRGFADWLKALDPRHEVPPPYRGQIGKNRPKPYIFSEAELLAFVACSHRVYSKNGLRRLTYSTLWPFLYITGLRIGEALALTHKSFDFEANTVRIPPQKGGYERLVPLHGTTAAALKCYVRARNRLLGARPLWFFIGEDGQRLRDDAARHAFEAVSKEAGLRKEGAQGETRNPRLHDFRHTFVVHTLLQWYREGKDIDDHILTLVDVLGHTSLQHTHWYIEAVPELLELASKRVRPIGESQEA
jgi:integrase/recombinase XerD